MYRKYRGFASLKGGKFERVDGNGVCVGIDGTYICRLTETDGVKKIIPKRVVPSSASEGIPFMNVDYIYVGDFIQKSFKERGETFSIYYKVVHNRYGIALMELCRDFKVENDMTVTRLNNKEHEGNLVRPTLPTLTECYRILGNKWENPELESKFA